MSIINWVTVLLTLLAALIALLADWPQAFKNTCEAVKNIRNWLKKLLHRKEKLKDLPPIPPIQEKEMTQQINSTTPDQNSERDI